MSTIEFLKTDGQGGQSVLWSATPTETSSWVERTGFAASLPKGGAMLRITPGASDMKVFADYQGTGGVPLNEGITLKANSPAISLEIFEPTVRIWTKLAT